MQVQLILKNLELVVKRALVEPVECRGAEHLIAGLGLISPKGIIKHLWRSTLNSTLIYVFVFVFFFVPKTPRWNLLELYVAMLISIGNQSSPSLILYGNVLNV